MKKQSEETSDSPPALHQENKIKGLCNDLHKKEL
jgi:hypothetical protein